MILSKAILRVEYFVDSDEMSDQEYEDQEFREFFITEDMIHDLVSEKVGLEIGQRVCNNNFFVNKI